MKNKVLYTPIKGIDFIELPKCEGNYALIRGYKNTERDAVINVVTLRHQISREKIAGWFSSYTLTSLRIDMLVEDASVWINSNEV